LKVTYLHLAHIFVENLNLAFSGLFFEIDISDQQHNVPTQVKHCLSLTCVKKPVCSKRDLLRWKVPASMSLFLKIKKIPALLYVGKGPEYRSFSDLRPVLRPEYRSFPDFQPVPSASSLSTGLKSQKGLYSGPVLLYQIPHVCNNCQFETMCECSICLQSQKTAS
jgi:hypothetical protein